MWYHRISNSSVILKAALFGILLLAVPGEWSATTVLDAKTPFRRAVTASAQAVAIPSYFPLNAQGTADWTTMCNAAPAVGMAIANMFNGPDNGSHAPNATWTARINQAHNAGILVLGYVYTGYADPTHPDYRTLAQVESAVNNWYLWYPTIDGIYVDETSTIPVNGQGPNGYYFQLARFIRSKPGKHLIALGQGGNAPDATYMADGEFIVNFESNYEAFTTWSAAPWTDGFDASRFWHLVHSIPSASIPDAVAHSRINNGGWLYATTRSLPSEVWSILPATTDWRTELESVQPLSRWRASNGSTLLEYRFQYANTWTWKRVYIDADRSTATGFRHGGIGADFLIENDWLYRYSGTGTNWSWSLIKAAAQTSGGGGDGHVNWSKWDLSRSDIGSTTDTYLVFEVERSGGPLKTGAYKYEHVYSGASTPGISQYFGENDSTRFYFEAMTTPPWSYRQIFIDVDSNSATGFRILGTGADYLVENGNLYRYMGTGTDWNWALLGWIAHPTRVGTTYDWWVWRADLKGPGNSGMFFNQGGARLVFSGNTGAPASWTPAYLEKFSP